MKCSDPVADQNQVLTSSFELSSAWTENEPPGEIVLVSAEALSENAVITIASATTPSSTLAAFIDTKGQVWVSWLKWNSPETAVTE